MLKRTLYIVLVLASMSAATAWAGDRTYANNREVSSKKSTGKTIPAFPDIARTPESPPAGPVPIPYPNTGQSTDTAKGSKKVKTDANPVMLKENKFSTSSGDEAGRSESLSRMKTLKSRLKRRPDLKNKQDLKEESD